MAGRLFADFVEAQNEIRRDLAELGVEVPPMYQSQSDLGDEFTTKELANYTYTVLNPDVEKLEGVTWDWVTAELEDRLIGGLNPGKAWKERPELWIDLMEFTNPRSRELLRGKFSYTYSERMGGPHIDKVIEDLKSQPFSRQLYLPVWREIDEKRRGERRVPCSLGYLFMQRQGRLHVTYFMRSCDFITHWPNDVLLAVELRNYIAREAGVDPGHFTQFVGSLHMYRKDAEGVF